MRVHTALLCFCIVPLMKAAVDVAAETFGFSNHPWLVNSSCIISQLYQCIYKGIIAALLHALKDSLK